VGQKTDYFERFITPVHDDVGKKAFHIKTFGSLSGVRMTF